MFDYLAFVMGLGGFVALFTGIGIILFYYKERRTTVAQRSNEE